MKMDQYCKEIKDFLDDNNNNKQEQPVQVVRLWEETWEQKKIGPRGDAIWSVRTIRSVSTFTGDLPLS
jgi:hypothetical protein